MVDRANFMARVFFINLPLGLIVLLISFSCVPESRDENDDRRLDWLGAAWQQSALHFLFTV